MSGSVQIIVGDCVEEMAKMPADSVDAIVADPPYGIRFMGKAWDAPGIAILTEADEEKRHNSESFKASRTKGGGSAFGTRSANAGSYDFSMTGNQAFQAWTESWAREAFSVLKPGGFAVVAGGTRTFHRLVCALEDAGFEIRDTIAHIYGSGFPKSKSMKDIERPELGTALKPAFEPWTLARKPLSEKNVAQNVLRHSTGALNIDGCRVHGGASNGGNTSGETALGQGSGWNQHNNRPTEIDRSMAQGRWPPNLLLSHVGGPNGCKPTGEVRRVKGSNAPGRYDTAHERNGYDGGWKRRPEQQRYADPDGTEPQEVWECVASCPIRLLDEMSGQSKSAGGNSRSVGNKVYGTYADGLDNQPCGFGDTGGASRFFPRFSEAGEAPFRYVAKASRRERNAGLEGMPEVTVDDGRKTPIDNPFLRGETVRANGHPTVKPIALMRWLVRLVTPPNGGTVLDPFAGSGSTGCAAVQEGFNFIGIEQDPEYAEIARRRIAYWSGNTPPALTEAADPTDPTFTGRLF